MERTHQHQTQIIQNKQTNKSKPLNFHQNPYEVTIFDPNQMEKICFWLRTYMRQLNFKSVLDHGPIKPATIDPNWVTVHPKLKIQENK